MTRAQYQQHVAGICAALGLDGNLVRRLELEPLKATAVLYTLDADGKKHVDWHGTQEPVTEIREFAW